MVRYRGALPDLFREGHSVVAEGFLRPLPASHSHSVLHEGNLITTAADSRAASGEGKSKSSSSEQMSSAAVMGGAGSRVGSKVAVAEPLMQLRSGVGGPKAGATADGDGGLDGSEGMVGEEGGRGEVSAKARRLGLFFAATEVLAKHDEVWVIHSRSLRVVLKQCEIVSVQFLTP